MARDSEEKIAKLTSTNVKRYNPVNKDLALTFEAATAATAWPATAAPTVSARIPVNW